ncbi:MAG: metallophosphoesterase [Herpetosiphonaceae bacterium]|nr:metallophosphoesterase [Herpetosiphonaceae bacterium]
MQVLTVSDEIAREVYSTGIRTRFGNVQLALGCGDLPPSYLEYIVSSLDVPCCYVRGNHDSQPEYTDYGATLTEPRGWASVEGRVVEVRGLTIAGLGGSIWYNGGKYQYHERQMLARVLLLLPRLLLRQRRVGHRLDILLSHSPPAGIHDGPRAHRGFQALVYLMEWVKPRYLIHGHVHKEYGYNRTLTSLVGTTMIINTAGYRLLDMEPTVNVQLKREQAVS